jgi:hypothetical protein
MPLLDHFHPPLSEERHWEGFHSKWANSLVDHLNDSWLPMGYFAEPHVHQGTPVEIDAATYQGPAAHTFGLESATATLAARVWTPTTPTFVMPATFPDTFEVQIVRTETGPTLVAAIEMVSPANKDRLQHRRAFALKCASYLCQGIAVLVVDVVTSRQANLHDEVVRLLPEGDAFAFPSGASLYAAAYRPIQRGELAQMDVWLTSLEVGQELPVMPLALTSELLLAIDLELTYRDACRKLRMVG